MPGHESRLLQAVTPNMRSIFEMVPAFILPEQPFLDRLVDVYEQNTTVTATYRQYGISGRHITGLYVRPFILQDSDDPLTSFDLRVGKIARSDAELMVIDAVKQEAKLRRYNNASRPRRAFEVAKRIIGYESAYTPPTRQNNTPPDLIIFAENKQTKEVVIRESAEERFRIHPSQT